ncbi:sugar kinase [Rhodoferax sp.]|uniref:sugar kinase n=1 Tax=Rhodoferax sp. TaxID=50421 RepID=UPI002715E799|nr:sugar kinase [Rhodoferax sp.]MDO8321168.1 sugar kinase [Rhodoferax sp.]MDP2677581.1 sugar kinase [Rhodoferax sp.]
MKNPIKVAFFGECMLELNGTAFGAMQQSYGGDTFNTAVYLSRCGGEVIKTWYATALGDDALSLELERRWAQDGLALDLVRHIPGRMPGLYQIQVDAQGERRFSFWRDNSAAKAYFEVAETPLEARIDAWDAFYFSGISLAILPADGRNRLLAFAQALRMRGATVVFDNNYRPSLWPDITVARDSFSRAFAVANTALITADDHQALFGFASLEAAVGATQTLNVFEVVIKRGAAPTLVRSGNSPWHSVPTQTLANVVDTTAAGDSFAAGYLSRRLRGKPPEEAAQFGNRLAARVITHRGAIIPLDAMADLL